jgi:hypothetical protein
MRVQVGQRNPLVLRQRLCWDLRRWLPRKPLLGHGSARLGAHNRVFQSAFVRSGSVYVDFWQGEAGGTTPARTEAGRTTLHSTVAVGGIGLSSAACPHPQYCLNAGYEVM